MPRATLFAALRLKGAGQHTDELEDDAFLTPPQAAGYLNCSKSFLDKARINGTGPPFIRLDRRKFLYSKESADEYALQRQINK